MIHIKNIRYLVSGRALFEGATARINQGHKVGLVGRNGVGKSTLLRLILDQGQLDGGEINCPAAWRIAMMEQELRSTSKTVLELVLEADKERCALLRELEGCGDGIRIAYIHERLEDIGAQSAPAKAAQILAGLGFDEAAQARPSSDFSGGWRVRMALARLLFMAPEVLLLDEPTNHLDLEACIWLEGFIRRYAGTVLVVSHDRGLLNAVCGEILHIEQGALYSYSGNYDRFERTRNARRVLQVKEAEKQMEKQKHLESFINRFKAKASKAKQAQSRIKMLQKMATIETLAEERSIKFDFPAPEPLASPLYTLDEVSVGYEGKAILSQLELRLDTDDRIALLGANGNGKSTLIKLIAGELRALSGEINKSRKLKVGYFAQHQSDALPLERSPLEHLMALQPKETEERLRAQLARFGFDQKKVETRISALSGGEKARLTFALISRERPHILLLDEPTNHLDMDARRALIEALVRYEGAVVLVSHDPELIGACADRLWLVDGGGCRPYEGDMEDYRAFLSAKGRSERPARSAVRSANKGHKKQHSSNLLALKKQRALAERQVEALSALVARGEKMLANPVLYESGNADKLLVLQKDIAEARIRLAQAEEHWFAAQEEQEALEADF